MLESEYRNARFLVDAAEYQLQQRLKAGATQNEIKRDKEAVSKAKRNFEILLRSATPNERRAISVSLAESEMNVDSPGR